MTAWVLGGEDGSSVVVTQCSDVEEAKRIALADPTVVSEVRWWLEDEEGHDDLTAEQQAALWLDQADVRLEHGRFTCTVWTLAEGYRQAWSGWDSATHQRAHGETTAVRFMPKPYQGPVG